MLEEISMLKNYKERKNREYIASNGKEITEWHEGGNNELFREKHTLKNQSDSIFKEPNE